MVPAILNEPASTMPVTRVRSLGPATVAAPVGTAKTCVTATVVHCSSVEGYGYVQPVWPVELVSPVEHTVVEHKSVGESGSAERLHGPKPAELLKSCLKSHSAWESSDNEDSDDEDSDDDLDPEECRLVYEQLKASNPEGVRLAEE